MTRPVFYFDEPGAHLEGAEPGDALHLGGEEGRHAAGVRRIGAGEGIDLVDGRGTRAVCEVAAAGKQGLDLRVVSVEHESSPEARLVLVQALAKGGRDEQAVETCTEIGIDAVIPWQSERAIVRWTGPKAQKGRAKWRGVVRAAAKQTRRARVPEVAEVLDSRGLAARVEGVVSAGGRVLVCHEEAAGTLSEHLRARPLDCPTGAEVWIIVGPEGGISERETGALRAAGGELIGLGRNVLRSSTAGGVCATLLSAALGRM